MGRTPRGPLTAPPEPIERESRRLPNSARLPPHFRVGKKGSTQFNRRPFTLARTQALQPRKQCLNHGEVAPGRVLGHAQTSRMGIENPSTTRHIRTKHRYRTKTYLLVGYNILAYVVVV
jgi:hypothetical protein